MSSEDQALLPTKSHIVLEDVHSKNWNYVIMASVLASAGLAILGVSYSSEVSNTANKWMNLKSSSSVKLYSAFSLEEKNDLFEQFKSDFGRDYSATGDEETRFSNFLAFLDLVDEMTQQEAALGGNAKHGISMFADLSIDEFKSRYLGFKSSGKELTTKLVEIEEYTGKETLVDWTGVYTTKMKNQGFCGSCWAFSTTEQVESDSIRLGYLTPNDQLSPQQIVSCDTTGYGCDGGDTITAYEYLQKAGGLEKEKKYPYISADGNSGDCTITDSSSASYSMAVEDYYVVPTEVAMKDYVRSTGPLSVCLSAEKWMTYTGGVLTYCGDHLPVDHCVQVVGVNTDEKYWIVRNQWSNNWGEDGFIYINEGDDACQIASQATYLTVKPVTA